MTKTNENYSELTLYTGLVNSYSFNGFIREGKFQQNSEFESEKERNLMAYRTIDDFVKMGMLQLCYNTLVKSEEEAEQLLRYAKENIGNAEDIIELVDCLHGKIRFNKKIRLYGWTEDKKDELIARLRDSGYNPEPEYSDSLSLAMTYPDMPEFAKIIEDAIRKRWIKSLQFFKK